MNAPPKVFMEGAAMTTEADIILRSRFGERWSHLLFEAGSCAHFYVHHAAVEAAGGQDALARLHRASWDLAELERDDGPEIADHFARLLGRLPANLAALRSAALAFAARPGETTREALLRAARVQFPTTEMCLALDCSPFADDGEADAWRRRRLPVGEC